MFQSLKDEAESTDFDSESLKEETEFNYKLPWFVQIDTVRDYFGEKIALYFRFLTFYTYHLSYMYIIAFVVEICISIDD